METDPSQGQGQGVGEVQGSWPVSLLPALFPMGIHPPPVSLLSLFCIGSQPPPARQNHRVKYFFATLFEVTDSFPAKRIGLWAHQSLWPVVPPLLPPTPIISYILGDLSGWFFRGQFVHTCPLFPKGFLMTGSCVELRSSLDTKDQPPSNPILIVVFNI